MRMIPGDVWAGVFSSCSGELTPVSGAPMGRLVLLLDSGGLKPSLRALSPHVGDSGAGSKCKSQRSSRLGRAVFPAEGPHLGLSSHVEGVPSQRRRSLCAALRPEPGGQWGRGFPPSIGGAYVQPRGLSLGGSGGRGSPTLPTTDLFHAEPATRTTSFV